MSPAAACTVPRYYSYEPIRNRKTPVCYKYLNGP